MPFNIRSLKTKLIIYYTVLFFIIMGLSSGSTYFITQQLIANSVDQSLTMQIELIKNSIETSAQASIKNYFRAAAHTGYDIVNAHYKNYTLGSIPEGEAKKRSLDLLAQQKLGSRGYVVVLENNQILMHPEEAFLFSSAKTFDFTDRILGEQEIFTEYLWTDIDQTLIQTKALYSIYFEPWDWYIIVTGYKSEFASLINIDDFEENILSISFGETGYPLMLDLTGTLLIHPEYKGVNMFNREDSMGEVTRESILKRNGKAEYFWKNPGEDDFRKKLTIYREIPEYGWIVAATAYESDFLKPLHQLRFLIFLSFILSFTLIIYLTTRISKHITDPIISIKNSMLSATSGNLSVRSCIENADEVGEIGNYFNQLIQSLGEKQQRLLEEERFSSTGRLVMKVSHHLNTPLGSALTAISFLRNELDVVSTSEKEILDNHAPLNAFLKRQYETIHVIESSLNNAITLINAFHQLSSNVDDHYMDDLALCQFLENLYALHLKPLIPSHVTLSIRGDKHVKINTYPHVIETIFVHLVTNSITHAFVNQSQGHIDVCIEETNKNVIITYSDNGVGIDAQDSEIMFQPFYAPANHMTSISLGHSIIYNAVVGALKGSIAYEGDLERGVRFMITLPK